MSDFIDYDSEPPFADSKFEGTGTFEFFHVGKTLCQNQGMRFVSKTNFVSSSLTWHAFCNSTVTLAW